MADVLGTAVVEIEPDVKNFAQNIKVEFASVTQDIVKSAAVIDTTMGAATKNVEISLEAVGKTSQKVSQEVADSISTATSTVGTEIDNIPAKTSKARKAVENDLDAIGGAGQKASDRIRESFSGLGTRISTGFDVVKQSVGKATDFIRSSFEKTSSSSDGAIGSVGKLGGVLGRLAASGASIGTLVPVLAAVGSAAAATAGAALILPGALASAQAAALTVKVAFTGISEALSADNAKDLAAALANLPLEAQQFTLSLRGVRDEFDGVRKSVQTAFFSGLSEKIDEVGKVFLPVVSEGLVGIAAEFNGVAKGFADTVTQGRSVAAVSSILANSAVATRNLGGALGPVTEALLVIAGEGSAVFAGLTTGVTGVAERFRDFVVGLQESGRLGEIMQGGIDALRMIFGVLQNVATIAGNVLGPLIAGAGELTTPLSAVLDTLVAFTSTSDFSGFVTQLAGVFSLLATALGSLLKSALDAVLPILFKLTTILSDSLAKIIPTLLPALQNLVTFFGDLLVAIIPLLEPILTLIEVLLPPLVAIIDSLIAAIDIEVISQFSEAIGTALNDAITALKPTLDTLAVTLGDVFSIIGTILSVFLEVAGVVIPIVIAALGFLLDKLLGVINFGLQLFIGTWNILKSVVLSVWEGIKSATSSAVGVIGGAIDIFMGNLRKIGEVFTSIRDTASQKIGELINFVRELPGKAAQAITDLGGVFVRAGESLIRSFVQGIKNMAGSVVNAVSNIVGSARDLLPFSPAKKGPLSGRGYVTYSGEALVRDFAASMGDVSAVTSAATKIASAAQAPFSTLGAGGVAGALGGMVSTSGGGPAGALARSAAELAAVRSTLALSGVGSMEAPTVQVFIGEQELTGIVTDVVVDRDRRTKRAVTAGGRRTP